MGVEDLLRSETSASWCLVPEGGSGFVGKQRCWEKQDEVNHELR